MIEKRQHPRQTVDFEASVTLDGSQEAIVGRVRDISIGGAFFVGVLEPAFGTKCTVSITFPSASGTLEFPAVVRWSSDEGVGLQFGLVGARETHAIAQVLKKARK